MRQARLAGADEGKATAARPGNAALRPRISEFTEALSGGEAALCATIYEVLLRRHLGADFRALLVWSRQHGPAGAGRRDFVAPGAMDLNWRLGRSTDHRAPPDFRVAAQN